MMRSRAMIRPIIEEIVDVAHAKNVDIHINDLISKIEAAYPRSCTRFTLSFNASRL